MSYFLELLTIQASARPTMMKLYPILLSFSMSYGSLELKSCVQEEEPSANPFLGTIKMTVSGRRSTKEDPGMPATSSPRLEASLEYMPDKQGITITTNATWKVEEAALVAWKDGGKIMKWAALLGLQTGRREGWQQLKIHSDSLQTVQGVRSNNMGLQWLVYDTVMDIRHFMPAIDVARCQWIPRIHGHEPHNQRQSTTLLASYDPSACKRLARMEAYHFLPKKKRDNHNTLQI